MLLAGLAWAAPVFGAGYTNTIAQVTAYITNQMTAGNIPGLAIALVEDQTVVWSAGFGYADLEGGVAADADTVFHVGSVSKAFLGTAYMQLLDQGRVDIEAPLTNYIAEFSMLPRFADAGTVTIRSLLNHHSGVPGDFFNGMITTRELDDYASRLIHCLQGDYPFIQVNQRNMYCNSGFMLLSEALRRITGTNFSAAVDAMLLEPLGMDASSFRPDKAAISNRLAAAYNATGERQPPEILNALGSGSMYSSANDQAKYIKMILADGVWQGQQIVSSNGIEVMTTPQLTNLPLNVVDSPQGLGWDDAYDHRFRYAGKVFWKDGATWYHCAFLGISRELKLGVAVIQNCPGNQCDAIGAEALRWAILDKTSQHWPTNTFVPAPAPVTNRPQAELDALAGLYVGGMGYHKVEAAAGTLTLLVDAYSDAPRVLSNIVPRANGWFSLTNSQDRQLAFTNLAGHPLLVFHGIDGAFESVEALGEQYLPAPLSAAWCARTNRVYRMVDMNPVEYFWLPGQLFPKTLRFKVKDSALQTEWMLGWFVIEPTNANVAFQCGVHYRKGGAVQAGTSNGVEFIQYASYRFMDEAAIPTLAVSTITNGVTPFANGTQWYWFSGQSGRTYRVYLTAGGEAFLRLTEREGITLSEGTNGLAVWACSSNGTYALAVCATNVCDFSLSLALNGIRPVPGDYDGDRKADPAVYAEGAGGWYVRLSASGYALATLSGFGGLGYSACAGDYDGDGKVDPAVYQAAAGNWQVKLSGSGYADVSLAGFGGPTWEAVAGDYDGDGKADPAVYNTTNGDWRVAMSSQGYGLASASGFGGPVYAAVQANYDSDRRYDAAVYNQTNGNWTVLLSAQNYITATLWGFGGAGWTPVLGDFDGDGLADPAIYSEATATWQVKLSGPGYSTASLTGFGGLAAYAAAADYDGDGKADPAFLDAITGLWHVKLSASGYAEVTAASGWSP
jgi:CubicO group peptidase (beta-lactamase class C family)